MEVMVSSGVMLLLMGFAVLGLKASGSYLARTETQLALDTTATTALSHICHDLAETNGNSAYFPSDSLLVLPLPRDVDGRFTVEPNGDLRWGVLVGYRKVEVDGVPQLIRQVDDEIEEVGAPPEVRELDDLPDEAWWQARRGPRRAIADGFVSLDVQREPAVKTALVVTLHLRKEAQGRQYGVKLSVRVTPRN